MNKKPVKHRGTEKNLESKKEESQKQGVFGVLSLPDFLNYAVLCCSVAPCFKRSVYMVLHKINRLQKKNSFYA